jgi:hypothetical protein
LHLPSKKISTHTWACFCLKAFCDTVLRVDSFPRPWYVRRSWLGWAWRRDACNTDWSTLGFYRSYKFSARFCFSTGLSTELMACYWKIALSTWIPFGFKGSSRIWDRWVSQVSGLKVNWLWMTWLPRIVSIIPRERATESSWPRTSVFHKSWDDRVAHHCHKWLTVSVDGTLGWFGFWSMTFWEWLISSAR